MPLRVNQQADGQELQYGDIFTDVSKSTFWR